MLQKNQSIYPTLARIALDILPIPASSVACKQLFSQGKLIATDHRSRLGLDLFKKTQLMKFAWQKVVSDWATFNSVQVEEVELEDYKQLLKLDNEFSRWALSDY